MNTIEELEKQLADNRAKRASGEESQRITDLQARINLEEQHGTLAAITASRYVPGVPKTALVRAPLANEYKRYKAQIYKAAQDKKSVVSAQEAQELLAKACWCYPETQEERDAMLDAFPGLLTPISMAATALAEGKTEEEGKD